MGEILASDFGCEIFVVAPWVSSACAAIFKHLVIVLMVWSQNGRFEAPAIARIVCSILLLEFCKDLGPSAPGATAPALLDCRLVVSRSIYIYKFYIFARARCYLYFCCFYYSFTTTVVFDFARRFQLLEFCFSCFCHSIS